MVLHVDFEALEGTGGAGVEAPDFEADLCDHGKFDAGVIASVCGFG